MSNVRIVPYDEKRPSFERYHETGGSEIRYAGFRSLEKIWAFAQDGVTDITGQPGSGKTEFALELLFFQAEQFGKVFLIYLPDVGSYNEIRRKLIVKYYKRPFRGYNNAIDEKLKGELTRAAYFIDNHFKILAKEDIRKPITPIDLWNFTADTKCDGILIDSWKNLHHDYKGTEVAYLDYVLSYRNELAESCNKHFMTIAHPVKTDLLDNGKRRIPDAYDISGGAAWYRNGKTIFTVDYPDKQGSQMDLYFSKVKPDTLGKVGSVIGCFDFIFTQSRYKETINGDMYFAGEAPKQDSIFNSIEPQIAPF